MNGEKDLFNILKIYRSGNIGPVNFYYLINKFKTTEKILENLDELFDSWKKQPNIIDDWKIEEEIEQTEKQNGSFVHFQSKDFPFKKQFNAPPVLIYKGRKELLKKNKISIVGTRNPSVNGIQFCKKITESLSKEGYVIVSGLAKGIDLQVHKSSLKTGTIGVIPGGIDYIYPLENKIYYEKISEEGLLITDQPINTPITTSLFVKRNSIIAHLGLGTIVVESMEKSGALITAEKTHQFKKPVFAVPGHPFDKKYSGNNRLLKGYGNICTEAQDVLSHFKNLKEEPSDFYYFAEFSEEEKNIIWNLVSHSPTNIQQISNISSIPIDKVLSVLIEMEIAQLVKINPDNTVYKISND